MGVTIQNSLKVGGTERGRGNKDFKKGDKLVQGVVALKRWWGAGTSLQNKGGVEGGAEAGVCE